VIGGVLSVTVPGFAIGAAGMALASRRVPRDVSRARWLKFGVFAAIVHVVLLAGYLGRPALLALLAAIVVAGSVEAGRAWRRVPAPRPFRVVIVYALIAAAVLAVGALAPPEAIVWAFLVVASGDGFAQVTGQLLGRRRLAPRLSPGKTVEGALGGLVAAVVCGTAAHSLIGANPPAAAGLAATLSTMGLTGDLAASWLKRRAGLKDYSNALPGQGGVLDRFDSFLGAMALGGWLLI
jgi:phosphatidate cytidylyltransferase